MKAKCIANTGAFLREFETSPLDKDQFGRFGASFYTEYGEVTIGEEYVIMGIISYESHVGFLFDDNGWIGTAPCQLFEITDPTIPADWQFRLIGKDERIYPFIQSFVGYKELCEDKASYGKLRVDFDKDTSLIYFQRKVELENREKEIAEQKALDELVIL